LRHEGVAKLGNEGGFRDVAGVVGDSLDGEVVDSVSAGIVAKRPGVRAAVVS